MPIYEEGLFDKIITFHKPPNVVQLGNATFTMNIPSNLGPRSTDVGIVTPAAYTFRIIGFDKTGLVEIDGNEVTMDMHGTRQDLGHGVSGTGTFYPSTTISLQISNVISAFVKIILSDHILGLYSTLDSAPLPWTATGVRTNPRGPAPPVRHGSIDMGTPNNPKGITVGSIGEIMKF